MSDELSDEDWARFDAHADIYDGIRFDYDVIQVAGTGPRSGDLITNQKPKINVMRFDHLTDGLEDDYFTWRDL